jgi:hypothetical protein
MAAGRESESDGHLVPTEEGECQSAS